jgi:hypothetical protein
MERESVCVSERERERESSLYAQMFSEDRWYGVVRWACSEDFGDGQGVRASGAGNGIDAKKKAQKFSRAVSGESLCHVPLFGCRGSLSSVCKAAYAC